MPKPKAAPAAEAPTVPATAELMERLTSAENRIKELERNLLNLRLYLRV